MRRWAPVVVVATVALGATVVVLSFSQPGQGTPVPDVRNRSPIGATYESKRWVHPLLNAGFCVDFRYEDYSAIEERTGRLATVADSYFIGDQDPEPGSRLPAGSTVTVIVSGSPMGGPEFNWDGAPSVCPAQRGAT